MWSAVPYSLGDTCSRPVIFILKNVRHAPPLVACARQFPLVLHLGHQSLLLLFSAASCTTSLAILSTSFLTWDLKHRTPPSPLIHSIGALNGLLFLGSSLAPPLAPVRVEEIDSVSDRQKKSIHEPLFIQSTCRHRLSWVGLRLEARQVLLDSFRCRHGRSLVHDLALILHYSKQRTMEIHVIIWLIYPRLVLTRREATICCSATPSFRVTGVREESGSAGLHPRCPAWLRQS